MYKGKFNCRITARCPECGHITAREFDYRQEKDELGKVTAEISAEVVCSRCVKIIVGEERRDLSAMTAGEAKGIIHG